MGIASKSFQIEDNRNTLRHVLACGCHADATPTSVAEEEEEEEEEEEGAVSGLNAD